MDITLNSRNELPKYLKQIGLNGIGAEIGVQTGYFSEILIRDGEFEKFYSIDFWGELTPDTFNSDGSNYIRTDGESLYNQTIDRLKSYGDKSVVIKNASIEASKLFEDEFFDFIYLDADHSFKGITDDILHWYPKVKRGGILAGHDYFDNTLVWSGGTYSKFEVKRAVDEYCKKMNLELFIIEEENWKPWNTWYFYKP